MNYNNYNNHHLQPPYDVPTTTDDNGSTISNIGQ